MSICTDVKEWIQEDLDGDLDDVNRERMRDHLKECEDCRRFRESLEQIVGEAATLPLDIQPERDLWPGISRRIYGMEEEEASPRRSPGPARWLSAAAAVLLIGTAVGWLLLREKPAATLAPAPSSGGAISIPSAQLAGYRSSGETYKRANAELLQIVQSRRDQLTPETRRVLDRNLEIIAIALADIRQALEKNPSNPELYELLQKTYRKEHTLLKRAATLPVDA